MGSGNSKYGSNSVQSNKCNNKNNSKRKIFFKPIKLLDKTETLKPPPPGIKGKSKKIKWSL
tara:strand:+ start:3910 stop:4092 length:183 start_codon:yes stop_codon:yes gene_type:complete